MSNALGNGMAITNEACGTCGWPVGDGTCDMCGADPSLLAYRVGPPVEAPVSGPRPEDYPALTEAFRSWRVQAWERMIELCLSELGIRERNRFAPTEVCGWSLSYESAAIYISYQPKTGEFVVEAPVVTLPEYQRVPLMRTLLELNASRDGFARFALRGSTVMLRYADRIENVSPPKLIDVIKEVCIQSDEHDNWLAEAFGAEMIGPKALDADMNWSFLEHPTVLCGFEAMARADEPIPVKPVHDYLTWIERCKSCIDACDPSGEAQVSGLLLRSTLFVLRELCAEMSPAPVSILLSESKAHYFSEYDNCPPAHATMDRLLKVAAIGKSLEQVAPLPDPPISPLPVDYRKITRQRLEALNASSTENNFLHIMIAGLSCEMLARAPVPTTHARRLREALRGDKVRETYRVLVELIKE
jgi:hypothetical protein